MISSLRIFIDSIIRCLETERNIVKEILEDDVV
jgi:hypothetical protein